MSDRKIIDNLTVGEVQDLIRKGDNLLDIHEKTGMDLFVLAFMKTNLEKKEEIIKEKMD